MQFVPMVAEHAMMMSNILTANAGAPLTVEVAVELEEIGGISAIEDGEVIAIAGIMPKWEGSGIAWAWLTRGWFKHARAITEEVIRGLDASPLDRIEMAVKIDFDRGHRWAERLGFDLETQVAHKWGPDGASYSIYSRVR